jgi:hypothetical protein
MDLIDYWYVACIVPILSWFIKHMIANWWVERDKSRAEEKEE